MGTEGGDRAALNLARQASVERIFRTLQPDGENRMAWAIPLLKHQRRSGPCNEIALNLQQRKIKHGD